MLNVLIQNKKSKNQQGKRSLEENSFNTENPLAQQVWAFLHM